MFNVLVSIIEFSGITVGLSRGKDSSLSSLNSIRFFRGGDEDVGDIILLGNALPSVDVPSASVSSPVTVPGDESCRGLGPLLLGIPRPRPLIPPRRVCFLKHRHTRESVLHKSKTCENNTHLLWRHDDFCSVFTQRSTIGVFKP